MTKKSNHGERSRGAPGWADSLLLTLNLNQRKAVLATEGPVLIIAGPGSGKTKTLTHRIAYLLRQGVNPDNILAVTFTNKAAEEMRERVRQLISFNSYSVKNQSTNELLNYSTNSPFIGTFHSFCVRILRAHAAKIGYTNYFSIYDEDEALGLVKEAMKETGINPKQFPPGVLRHTISSLKTNLLTPTSYADTVDTTDLFPKTVHGVWIVYQKHLKESNAMDFDDLLMNTHALFGARPEILAQYQNRFRYIHVDEYQDTDRTQYMIMNLLARHHRNIAVVGDDGQSIYSFRGAEVENILSFEKDWPDARVIVLDQNYRSTRTILRAAGSLIANNKRQKEKNLWTEKPEGEPITLLAAETGRHEAIIAASVIRELLKKGSASGDIAVLYRTNAQSRLMEESLLASNIPYRLIGGVRFFDRKEIKDIIAYMRVLTNPQDLGALKRIINVPPRGIGKKIFLRYLSQRAGNPGWPGTAASSEATGRFDALLEELGSRMRDLPTSSFIKFLLSKLRFKDYLDDKSTNAEERWQNVEELVNQARQYEDEEPPGGIHQLLEHAALMTSEDRDQTSEGITLMTIHAAKGLEFQNVFILGLEENLFPHSRSLSSARDLEEERRLCYVGITRAKEKLFLSYAASRMSFGAIQVNPPSRFLGEIPEQLLELYAQSLEQISLD